MKINIIGAGITGLSAAYFFAKEGHEVKVFEATPEVGGLTGVFPVNGTSLEKYYHHIFTGHTELIALIKELNLAKELFFCKAKMGFFYGDRIYPFANARDLLFFTPLKLKDRIHLGLSSIMMTRIKDWHNLEKMSAMEWLRRYSGDESCKIIWEPLLKMKFGDEYEQISAAWLWNRVVDRKKSKEGEGGKETLGYIKGGYKLLLDALAEKITTQGGEIYTNTFVERICEKSGESFGVSVNGEVYDGDILLSTIPIPAFLHITPSLPVEYEKALAAIKYQGSLCVVLKLKKPLSDYYWTNVSDANSPFVGIIEHTNLVSPEMYNNFHLVYLTKYVSSEDSIFLRKEEDIYKDFIVALKRIFPKFREEEAEEHWVFRDRFSQPVFVKNYSKIMPEFTTPIKNLYLLNTSQIYPQSRCLNSSIIMAQKVVVEILNKNGKE